MKPLAIGTLSKESGVKVPTIRFYEQIGLLPAPPRTESNRRTYGLEDVRRLRFIRHARELGFEVEDIRTLLAMTAEPQASCDRADSIARHHLTEIDRRIAQLTALRASCSGWWRSAAAAWCVTVASSRYWPITANASTRITASHPRPRMPRAVPRGRVASCEYASGAECSDPNQRPGTPPSVHRIVAPLQTARRGSERCQQRYR